MGSICWIDFLTASAVDEFAGRGHLDDEWIPTSMGVLAGSGDLPSAVTGPPKEP